MTVAASTAANAYANAAKIMNEATKSTGEDTKPQSSGFSSLLQDVVQDLTSTGVKADKNVMAVATGKADIVDVVTAVAETELTVQTLVSVRDRVITAYQEILRMPI